MCEETKRCFAGTTTEDRVEVGTMFDMALEQGEAIADRLDLMTRGLLANAVITRGVVAASNPEAVAEVVNGLYRALVKNPPGPPPEDRIRELATPRKRIDIEKLRRSHVPNERTIELAAEAAHEVNRAFCAALGDTSHHPWAETPETIKESARVGVRLIIKNPTTGPEQQHQAWLEFKRQGGWTWGPSKDPDTKTHPCLVPYQQLPPWERAKDTLFGVTARAVLERCEMTELVNPA